MTLPTELLPLSTTPPPLSFGGQPSLKPPLAGRSFSEGWWRGEDSNLRSSKERWVYSPVPLTTRPPLLNSTKHVSCLHCFGHPPKWSPGSLQVSQNRLEYMCRSMIKIRFRESRVLLYLRALIKWSWREDLNPRPADYKSAALPAELRQHWQSF